MLCAGNQKRQKNDQIPGPLRFARERGDLEDTSPKGPCT